MTPFVLLVYPQVYRYTPFHRTTFPFSYMKLHMVRYAYGCTCKLLQEYENTISCFLTYHITRFWQIQSKAREFFKRISPESPHWRAFIKPLAQDLNPSKIILAEEEVIESVASFKKVLTQLLYAPWDPGLFLYMPPENPRIAFPSLNCNSLSVFI